MLRPADPRSLADLAVFTARAARADPGGAARLRAEGGVLAVLVCPLREPGATVLGARALALAEPVDLDVTVELAALADRLAARPAALAVPPVEVLASAWAGVVPPRSGWAAVPVPGAQEGGALVDAAWRAVALLGLVADGEGGGAPDGPEGAVRAGRAGPWLRLATSRGDVLARRPLLA